MASEPLLDRALGWAKKALGMSKEEAAIEPAPEMAKSEAREESVANRPRITQPSEDLGQIFARQLAVGLWETRDSSEKGRFMATTEILERCVREGIDTSHSVYGAQVVKAVEALSALAETWAQAGQNDSEVIRALLVISAISTGKRARTKIEVIATTAKSKAVKSIAGQLSNRDEVKKRIVDSAG